MVVGLSEIVRNLSMQAGFGLDYADDLSDRLRRSESILDEFIYYIKTGDFKCSYRVLELTIVDIMVWQIDHFKSHLDRDDNIIKNNPAVMVLKAFDTMLKMEQNPQKYMHEFVTETGTDYEGNSFLIKK